MFSALLSLFSSATGASAGAAAATNSIFPSLLSAASLFSSTMGIFGALQAGREESQSFTMQALQREQQARQERIKALEESNAIKRKMLQNISSSNAMFGARGISLESGTPLEAQQESRRNANASIIAAMNGGETAALGEEMQGFQLRRSAKAARRGGRLDALRGVPTLLEAGASLYGAGRGMSRGA